MSQHLEDGNAIGWAFHAIRQPSMSMNKIDMTQMSTRAE